MQNDISQEALSPFLEQLKALFQQIDAAYTHAATANQFICQGCQDSCCKTRFFHHTYLEYYLLREGILQVSRLDRNEIMGLAGNVLRKSNMAGPVDGSSMCPLNSSGMCRLYEHRPMICRMHGIAHELIRPDGVRIYGSGCHLFETSISDKQPVRLNRTPFYKQMAELESKLRSAFGLHRRLKLTIAEMIIASK